MQTHYLIICEDQQHADAVRRFLEAQNIGFQPTKPRDEGAGTSAAEAPRSVSTVLSPFDTVTAAVKRIRGELAALPPTAGAQAVLDAADNLLLDAMPLPPELEAAISALGDLRATSVAVSHIRRQAARALLDAHTAGEVSGLNQARASTHTPDVETLAIVLHEAGRAAVERGLTVGGAPATFIAWAHITEAAREGRRVQARELLSKFHMTPNRGAAAKAETTKAAPPARRSASRREFVEDFARDLHAASSNLGTWDAIADEAREAYRLQAVSLLDRYDVMLKLGAVR